MRPAPLIVLVVVLLAPGASTAFAEEEALPTPGPEAEAEGAVEVADSPVPDEGGSASQGGVYRAAATPLVVEGPPVSRLAFSLAGGWPAALLDVTFAASDVLATNFQVGYLYGSPHAGIRTASGVQVALGARLRLLQRARLELSLGVTAGVVIGLDRDIALVSEEVISNDVQPIGTMLDLDITVSWRLLPALALKLGLAIPALVVLDLADRPDEDAWELAVPFAARAGAVYRLLDWLSFFAIVDVGPALTVVPTDWSTSHYEQDVGVEVYLRVSAGLTFTPWR